MSKEVVEVHVVERANPSFWAAFILVGLFAVLWQNIEWVLLGLLVAAVAFAALRAAGRRRALRERADRQIGWWLSGDPRWITGQEQHGADEPR